MSVQAWIADQLAGLAARRLRRRHPEWAEAILAEHHSLPAGPDQLGWALGALRASFTPPAPDIAYPLMLTLAVAGVTLHQWSADEGIATVLVLVGAGLGLGLARPKLFLLSGLAVGLVVAAVNGFEALSGIRPAYEIHPRTLMHAARWLVLVIPALAGAAAGRELSHRVLRDA